MCSIHILLISLPQFKLVYQKGFFINSYQSQSIYSIFAAKLKDRNPIKIYPKNIYYYEF